MMLDSAEIIGGVPPRTLHHLFWSILLVRDTGTQDDYRMLRRRTTFVTLYKCKPISNFRNSRDIRFQLRYSLPYRNCGFISRWISRILMAFDTTSRWLPQTDVEREMVQRELTAITSSHHFRNSKRYPALLKYVVAKTLDGHADQLKERTLGVEVFDRPPDYDTNADPIVRFSAGETRKRIAQYYHETGKDSRLQIDLPLGSYVPEFTLRKVDRSDVSWNPVPSPAAVESETVRESTENQSGLEDTKAAVSATKSTRSRLGAYSRWAAILLVAIVPVGLYTVHKAAEPIAAETIWGPLLKSPGSVLFVVGNGPRGVLTSPSPPDQANSSTASHGPYNHISFNEAVALSRLTDMLVKHSKPYQIKEADLATLQDMHGRPVVLIGAYNNLWTMRLSETLRFHFQKDGLVVRIVDANKPDNHDWSIDYAKPYSAALFDYAIVARYVDPTTNGEILIVAGIGAYGTESASDSAASPQTVENLLAGLPGGWRSKNMEMVVRTPIINGEAGPPTLMSATTW
jgi:hypothetical protein